MRIRYDQCEMALDLDQLPRERIADLCRHYRIRRLAIFGSALREDFTLESDVDVLVEFEPTTRVGLAFFAIQEELSEILGRKVDLQTEGFLSKYFRDEVLAEAKSIYVAA
jgi:predicted nucleotidyltransferase